MSIVALKSNKHIALYGDEVHTSPQNCNTYNTCDTYTLY